MAQFKVDIEIKGLKELKRKVRDPRLLGDPLRTAFRSSIDMLARRTESGTPVDRGDLKRGIKKEMDKSPLPKWARIFTKVAHGIFVERGTKPHFPPFGPGSSLAKWSRRHNIVPFLVARAISRRGTKGHHMFENALVKGQGDLRRIFERAARDIERQWAKRSRF